MASREICIIGCAFSFSKRAGRIRTNFYNKYLTEVKKQVVFKRIDIDIDKPLLEQGPFHIILHKVDSDVWKVQLAEYIANNPQCLILDAMEATAALTNRVDMLHTVSELKIEGSDSNEGEFGIPPSQTVIFDREGLLSEQLKLKFPLLLKPLVADASVESHKMVVAYNRAALMTMAIFPLVIQELVGDGQEIYRVYVSGDDITHLKGYRKADPELQGIGKMTDLFTFPKYGGLEDEWPLFLFTDIAMTVRKALNLNLFTFYIAREANTDTYLLFYINYFHGFAKTTDYGFLFTQYLIHQSVD